jgi:polyhydroxyalkanoate synthase
MEQTIPLKFTDNLVKLIEKYHVVYEKLSQNHNKAGLVADPLNIKDKLCELMGQLWSNPSLLMEYQIDYYQNQINIINNIQERFYHHNSSQDLFQQNSKDSRFQDKAWDENMYFNYLKQSYLMTAEWLNKLILHADIKDKRILKKIEFYINQFINAISPTNFAITNPQVIQETFSTNGENLLKGLDNLLEDLDKSEDYLKIKSTDRNYFTIGKNIACTEGKIVYQNELMQLIHYNSPTTSTYSKPLLIIPPWINKYYILDLKPENSFVHWIVEQGYSVYLISWINPTKDLADKDFEDYMLEGPVDAIEKILINENCDKVNCLGYCIGGTLLACTLSYLKKAKKNYVSAATFLTTLVDFADAGDLSLFIDDQKINEIDKYVKDVGYLSADDMTMTFNLLKSNEMIWSFYINNYLLGKEPFPFDLLFWNGDSTRLPAVMHSYYLRNMYKDNLLCKPNKLMLGGKKINIKDIKIPCYFLSTIDDHIAPWKSTFKTLKLIGTNDAKFVLAASGHVAGVVNHPNKNKYCFWLNDEIIDASSSKWLKHATQYHGSWWHNWHDWLSVRSGKKKATIQAGEGNLLAIEDAPGSYVQCL